MPNVVIPTPASRELEILVCLGCKGGKFCWICHHLIRSHADTMCSVELFSSRGGTLKCVRIIPWYTIIITSRLVILHPSSFGYRWVTANKATGFFLVFSFFGALHRKCDPKGSNTSGTGASSRRRIIECIVWMTSLVACFCFFPFATGKYWILKKYKSRFRAGYVNAMFHFPFVCFSFAQNTFEIKLGAIQRNRVGSGGNQSKWIGSSSVRSKQAFCWGVKATKLQKDGKAE